MKQMNIIARFAASCAAAVLLASCLQGIAGPGVDGVSGGVGLVRVSIAGSQARTLFPAAMSGFAYSVAFSAEGKETVTKNMSGPDIAVQLETGTWNITVSAKTGDPAQEIGRGSAGVTVNAGETAAISVAVLPLAGGTNGSLAWSVDIPAGVNAATLTISDSGGAVVSGYNQLDLINASASVAVNGTMRSGTVSLAPGSYLAAVRLSNGALHAGNVEAAHVYTGQTTTAAWAYTAGDFSNTTDFGGSVNIIHSDKITIGSASLKLYEQSGDTVPFDTVALTAGTGGVWTFTGAIPDSYASCYAEVTAVTANGTITAAKELLASVTTGLTLTAVNLYALTADVNSGGTLTIAGTSVINSQQIDLLGGSQIAIAAAADSGYVVETDPSNASYTVNADAAITARFKEEAVTALAIFDETDITANLTGTVITIASGEEVQLIVVRTPASAIQGTVSWTKAAGDSITVSAAGTVQGISEDSTGIQVSASIQNGGMTSPVTASLTVKVSGAAAPVDPNLIWKWEYAVNGGFTGSFEDSDAVLTGTGKYTTVPVSRGATASRISNDAASGGILLDASGGTNAATGPAALFAVGTGDTASSSASSAPSGIFDLKSANSTAGGNGSNQIKVTIDCEFLVAALGNRSFSVFLNNNTATGTATPLSDGSNQGRIFYWQNTPGGEGAPSNHASNGNWDAVNNRLTSKTFTPAAFNQTEGNLATLEHAFLGIIALGWNSNNTGAKAVIKSIKIEYVE